MEHDRNQRRKYFILLILIIAGEVIFFLPFLLPRIFRPTILAVFDITNLQLGTFFSVYGVIAMVSYVLGGPLADRFPARKLMAVALWLTSVGGFVMVLVPDRLVLLIIYGLWGFTTIFLFWAALIRATREWGGTGYQGRAFGWLEGGRGAVAATLGTLTWLVFAKFTIEAQAADANHSVLQPIQIVILITSIITAATGWLVWKTVPDSKLLFERDTPGTVLRKILKLLKMPSVWSLSVIIICAYSGYKITDDFSLYAREVLGFTEVGSAAAGTVALWLRALVAIIAGFLADRFTKSGLITFAFGFMFLGSLITGLGILKSITLISLLNLGFIAIGVYALRTLYFAVLREAGIPLILTGTAVGIVSFLGYTPEVFMSPWMGHLLDSHPGTAGHRYVFFVLSGFGLIGMAATVLFRHFAAKAAKEMNGISAIR